MSKDKEVFWLVFGESDGWVVHKSHKEAERDYKSILAMHEEGRLIKVIAYEELESEE
jgi:hypothetical protein